MTARCLVLVVALAGCAGRRNAESIVLQGRVSDATGGAEAPACPWAELREVRLDAETVWLDDVPWVVDTKAAADRFVGVLGLCGEADAIPAFRAWRAEEERPPEPVSVSVEAAGTTLLVGAIEAIAVEAGAAADPRGGQLAHAVREQNLTPVSSPAAKAADAALQAAREAFVAALRDEPRAD